VPRFKKQVTKSFSPREFVKHDSLRQERDLHRRLGYIPPDKNIFLVFSCAFTPPTWHLQFTIVTKYKRRHTSRRLP
jgi:hypothetical protein